MAKKGSGLTKNLLTRATLGYFYNAPHREGAISSPPPSDLRNYWTDSKNSSGIRKPWKNCLMKTNFNDLGVTSDVTGQVKVKMFDISGLVTSASKISMLSAHKANESTWIVSLTFESTYHFLCFVTIIQVKVISGHQVKKKGQTKKL